MEKGKRTIISYSKNDLLFYIYTLPVSRIREKRGSTMIVHEALEHGPARVFLQLKAKPPIIMVYYIR
jgi:hypothetical protein